MEREKPYSYREQIVGVLLIEGVLVAILISIATAFWSSICTDSLKSCVAQGTTLGPLTFLLLSALRPFVFTPNFFMAMVAGPAFGTVQGVFLSLTGSLLSTVVIVAIGRAAGKRLVSPWMTANLPETARFIRQQDYKIAFFLRLVPFVPFDVGSLLFGAFSLRWRHVIWTTILGSMPEAIVFARLGSPDTTLTESAFNTLGWIAVAVIMPLLVGEFLSRRNGRSMWQQAILVYKELRDEVQKNNLVRRKAHLSPDRTPVLLLYGFFSSRRALGILEKRLTAHGFDVISFNLGGLLGTFFTSSILDTAALIDEKLKRQMTRFGFKKVHVVAHSKGGLVALWWLLKLGGDRYCDKLITLGTPYKGSRLTYLALITPFLGLLWRDMWQMRPRSTFLRQLHMGNIPEGVDIYCFNSTSDRVATGDYGLFQPAQPSPRIHSVPFNEVTHFEFLSRRQVADRIAAILRSGESGQGDKDSKQPGTIEENALLRQG